MTARIGGRELRFGPRDVFVVPAWDTLSLEADRGTEATVLFAFSDRPVQEALGLWRERKA